MSFAVSAVAAAAATVGSAVIGSSAAKSAANTQAAAARDASNAQLQAQREALTFQREQADLAQANQRPWLTAGQNALDQLALGTRTGVPATSSGIPVNAAGLSESVYNWLQSQPQVNGTKSPLVGPWQQVGTSQAAGTPLGFLMQNSTAFSKPNTAFSKPTTAFTKPNDAFSKPFQFEADPGYDFRMAEGMRGINNGAAARGGVLSGAALKAASKYNQNFASNEYQNAYGRYQTDETGKYNRYQTDNTGEFNRYMQTNTDAYNRYQTDNTGQFNRDVTNQTNQFNRLASIAGVGQTAANQMSNTALQTGQQVSANLMGTAQQIGQNTIGAGNALAAGQIGQANALSGAIGQGFNMYQSNQMMNALANRGSGYNPVTAPVSGGYASEAARIQAQGY